MQMLRSWCCIANSTGMSLRLPMALFGLGWLVCAQPVCGFDREQVLEQMRQSRPADLQVLIERPAPVGTMSIGIYAVKPTPSNPDTRSYQLWEESASDLNIYFESVNCSTAKPVRVKRTQLVVYVRTLNPGGPITDVNREDHLVWWAACVPEVAGTDPATLRQKALDLGFSTLIPEQQEQFPALAR